MCSFEKIYEKQKELQVAYNSIPVKSNHDRNEKLTGMILALEDELHEAMREFAWRTWTSNSGEMNVERVKEELRDAFQFMMNCFILLGVEPDEIYELTTIKQKKNFERISENYTDRIANEQDR